MKGSRKIAGKHTINGDTMLLQSILGIYQVTVSHLRQYEPLRRAEKRRASSAQETYVVRM